MVSRLLVAFAFLFSAATTAAPQLLLEVDKTQVQIGHPINATLYGIDLRARLSELELSELNKQSGVEILEVSEADANTTDERWPNQSIQSLTFKLYPRSQGTLTIPAINFAGSHTQAQTIQVTDSFHKRSDTRIQRELFISTQQPWERQQVRIEYQITTIDKFVSLQTDKPDIPGFEVHPLPVQKKSISRNGTTFSQLRIGWVLFPLTTGHFTLELPAIDYRKSGRTLRRFYLPQQTLTVKALPPYIPPTMPVGNLTATSSLNSDSLLLPNRLYYWQLTVNGNGVSPNWLPPLMQQIKSSESLRFLPKDTRQQTDFTDKGLQSHETHIIPFKAAASGKLLLPDLRIQFFNPDSAKIDSLYLTTPTPLVLSTGWRVLLGGVAALLLLWTGKLIYLRLTHALRRRRLRQQAFALIKTANTVSDLRQALSLLARAENWPLNLTLRDWAQHWQGRYRVNRGFESVLQQLSQACYRTNQSLDLMALRDLLWHQLARN